MLGDGLSAIGVAYILICMLRGGAALYQICIGGICQLRLFFPAGARVPGHGDGSSDPGRILQGQRHGEPGRERQIPGLAPAGGALLAVSDIKLLLILDICTFFLTVITTALARRGLTAKAAGDQGGFSGEPARGWRAVTRKRG